MQEPSAQSTPVSAGPGRRRRSNAACRAFRCVPALRCGGSASGRLSCRLSSVAALFVAASWLGAFAALPSWARLVVLAAFAVAGLASLIPLASIAPPGACRKAASHRPRFGREAWARKRLGRSPRRRQGGWRDAPALGCASPALAEARFQARGSPGRVPAWWRATAIALRTAPLLILAAAYFAAGPDRLGKVAAALDPRASGGPSVEGRIDGWIDPPTYTRMPPLVIDFAKSQDGVLELRAPVGSTLGAALAGGFRRRGATDAGAEAAAADIPPRPGVSETRWRITGDGAVTVTGGPRETRLSIASIPNEPPTIRIVGRTEDQYSRHRHLEL